MNLEMRNMPDHFPVRGDQVELWLKECRDEWDFNSAVYGELDNLIEEYRMAALKGYSLEEVVNGPHDVYKSQTRKKKLSARPDPINTEDLA